MVDTCVSGAYGAIRGGSSPPFGISKLKIKLIQGRRTPAKQSLAMVQARVSYRFSGQFRCVFVGYDAELSGI